MSERLTDAQIAEIEGRQNAVTDVSTMDELRAAYVAKDQHDDDDIRRLLAEVKALKADNERLRERIALLEQPRESMLEQAARILRNVNEAAGQEGD